MTATRESLAVVRALAIRKMKTAPSVPWPSRVKVPVSCAELSKQ